MEKGKATSQGLKWKKFLPSFILFFTIWLMPRICAQPNAGSMSVAIFQPYVSAIIGPQSKLVGIVLLLGLIALFCATLAYMLGTAFNLQVLKNWAKSEFMQIIVTFLLMSCILVAYGHIWNIMINVVSGIYKSTQPQLANPSSYYEPFSFAQAYIKQTLLDCEKAVYRVVYDINFYYRLFSRLGVDAIGADPVGGWYTSIYTGFFEYVAGHINYLLLLNYIQIRFLSIIKYVMPLLLEAGLVLRIFPISRGAGGLLIAIAIGFYVVYPVSISILMVLLPSPDNAFCTGFRPPPLLDLSDGGVITNQGDLHEVAYNIKASSNEISSIISKLENFLAVFYIQGMFLPLVSLIITFTFIRQTGSLFGADLNEIGRGLIKLI